MNIIAPADLMFLLLENHNSPMHVAGLSIYSPPPESGPTFVADLVKAWRRYPRHCHPSTSGPCSTWAYGAGRKTKTSTSIATFNIWHCRIQPA